MEVFPTMQKQVSESFSSCRNQSDIYQSIIYLIVYQNYLTHDMSLVSFKTSENIRRPCFQGVQKVSSGMKWVKMFKEPLYTVFTLVMVLHSCQVFLFKFSNKEPAHLNRCFLNILIFDSQQLLLVNVTFFLFSSVEEMAAMHTSLF